MIRAHRVNATAQDETTFISGWNISPNVQYSVTIIPGASSCAILLYKGKEELVAAGAFLPGEQQPCVLIPQSGHTVGMVDEELGWHVLLATIHGTEDPRTFRMEPVVDLPDEIHPIYSDDDLAVARARAAIDEAAHYRDDVTATYPLGLGAGLGDVVSVPVDGVPVIGQSESITWTGTPDGSSEQAVIRRHVAIAPDPYVEPVPIVPPVVADDSGMTMADETTSGNVLINDELDLTVVAVNGLSTGVGQAVAGSNGGEFTIVADGSWSFDPGGDFVSLAAGETAETSATYYASDGVAEAQATLTVTVTGAGLQLWTPANTSAEIWFDAFDANTISLESGVVSQWADKSGKVRHAIQEGSSARPTYVDGSHLSGDGNDTLAVPPWSLPTANIDIFVVLRRTADTSGIAFGQISTNRLFAGIASNTALWFGAGGTSINNVTYATTIGEYNIFRYRLGSGMAGLDVNGAVARKMTVYSGTAGGAAFRLFAGGGTDAMYLTGDIAETVIVPANLHTDQIYGYLAHKHGCAGKLPFDHPYKAAAPTV